MEYTAEEMIQELWDEREENELTTTDEFIGWLVDEISNEPTDYDFSLKDLGIFINKKGLKYDRARFDKYLY